MVVVVENARDFYGFLPGEEEHEEGERRRKVRQRERRKRTMQMPMLCIYVNVVRQLHLCQCRYRATKGLLGICIGANAAIE